MKDAVQEKDNVIADENVPLNDIFRNKAEGDALADGNRDRHESKKQGQTNLYPQAAIGVTMSPRGRLALDISRDVTAERVAASGMSLNSSLQCW